ncbi:MAG: hypothetical protein KJ630_15800 [Proteobacteria bacterium]|nr:hypothetical protein [Pseudomonadota bacterium]
MKKLTLSILAASLFFCQSSLSYAEGKATHSAYKVTSYNLGAITDNQGSGRSRYFADFQPLLITNAVSDILNSEHVGKVFVGEAISPTSNANGIAVGATFDATQKISIQGTFGVTRNLWAPDSLNYENESSWEANLGVIYKLVRNLSYELHFGYMDTGTLFNDRSSYTNVESIIMISNQLTMSF